MEKKEQKRLLSKRAGAKEKKVGELESLRSSQRRCYYRLPFSPSISTAPAASFSPLPCDGRQRRSHSIAGGRGGERPGNWASGENEVCYPIRAGAVKASDDGIRPFAASPFRCLAPPLPRGALDCASFSPFVSSRSARLILTGNPRPKDRNLDRRKAPAARQMAIRSVREREQERARRRAFEKRYHRRRRASR